MALRVPRLPPPNFEQAVAIARAARDGQASLYAFSRRGETYDFYPVDARMVMAFLEFAKRTFTSFLFVGVVDFSKVVCDMKIEYDCAVHEGGKGVVR